MPSPYCFFGQCSLLCGHPNSQLSPPVSKPYGRKEDRLDFHWGSGRVLRLAKKSADGCIACTYLGHVAPNTEVVVCQRCRAIWTRYRSAPPNYHNVGDFRALVKEYNSLTPEQQATFRSRDTYRTLGLAKRPYRPCPEHDEGVWSVETIQGTTYNVRRCTKCKRFRERIKA